MGLAKSTYDRLQASQRQVKQRHIHSRGLSPRILNNKSTEVYETSTNRRAMRFEPCDDGQQLRHKRQYRRRDAREESEDHYADASSEGSSYGDETEYELETVKSATCKGFETVLDPIKAGDAAYLECMGWDPR